MKLTFSIDTSQAERRIRDLQAAMPKAVAVAVTDTVREVEREVQAEIRNRIDRPRPFTERALYVRPATPSTLTARVGFKPLQATYLRALIEGGPRAMKASESRLGGRYFVPGPGVALDAYGNVSRGVLRGILQAVRGGGKYRGGSLIVGKPPGTDLDPGVWLKTARTLRPLLLFVDAPPRYEQRLDFYGIAERVARSNFRRNVEARVRSAAAKR